MPEEAPIRTTFVVDRMLGTLCRYLRFLGYDALSASSLREGNTREDTLLLKTAGRKGSILLTRDRELAARGGEQAILVTGETVLDQLRELVDRGLISTELRLDRCSLCNEPLRPAREREILGAPYAPRSRKGQKFFWCRRCRKLYWLGSHGRSLEKRIKEGL